MAQVRRHHATVVDVTIRVHANHAGRFIEMSHAMRCLGARRSLANLEVGRPQRRVSRGSRWVDSLHRPGFGGQPPVARSGTVTLRFGRCATVALSSRQRSDASCGTPPGFVMLGCNAGWCQGFARMPWSFGAARCRLLGRQVYCLIGHLARA